MSKLSIAKRAEFVNGIYSDYCSDFLDDIHVALHDIAIHLARKDSEIEYDFDELLDTYFEELRDSFEIQEMSEIGERIFLLINSELPGNRQFSEIEMAEWIVYMCDYSLENDEILAKIRSEIEQRRNDVEIEDDFSLEDLITMRYEDMGGIESDLEAIEWANILVSVIETHYKEYLLNENLVKEADAISDLIFKKYSAKSSDRH